MSSTQERARDILKETTVLGGLPDEAIDQLSRRAHFTSFSRGDNIYRRGDSGDSMMVILSGRVKISAVTPQAREIVVNFLGRGDVNGDIAVLDGGPRTADATALETTEALVLYRRDLMPVLTKSPDAMLEIIAVLCERLRQGWEILEGNSLEMSGRMASGLLRLAHQHGKMTKAGIEIGLKLSQRDLGNYVGLSRENVSRQLTMLKDRGIISSEGNSILILDEPGLTAIAESEGHEE